MSPGYWWILCEIDTFSSELFWKPSVPRFPHQGNACSHLLPRVRAGPPNVPNCFPSEGEKEDSLREITLSGDPLHVLGGDQGA